MAWGKSRNWKAKSQMRRTKYEKPDVTFESHETAHEFVIVFRRKSNQVTNGVANGVTHQVEHQVHPSKPLLTKTQKDIVNFCSVPRSAQEILERIGLTNQTFNRKKYIQPLVDMGVLEMTNPENPNASNQKYRKVRK